MTNYELNLTSLAIGWARESRFGSRHVFLFIESEDLWLSGRAGAPGTYSSHERLSSSSSDRAGITDRHDSPSPLLPIRHRFRQVFCVASRILTELLDVGLRRPTRSSASMRGGPQEHVAYELIPASPAMSGVVAVLFPRFGK